MSDFYRAFEDRYRGNRETIKARLRAYVPFVEPLLLVGQPPRAIDLGCGRGEWLELLREVGFSSEGVDLDEAMLAACTERGLTVRREDALDSLRRLPASTMAVVTAFHVVEHLPFDEVRILVAEALRVLVPGGLLILETPNPENLVVGATSFYMDPSHLRPIPSELLAFVVEYTGFERHKVVRLNETPGIQASDTVGLIQTLDGVSPDYGVIGQKAAPAAMLARFDQPFGSHYGIRLGTLAARFDQQLAARFGKAEDRAGKAEDRAGRAEARLAAAEDRVGRAEADLAQARDHAAQIEARLNQVMSSYSWRIVGRLDRGAQRLVAAVRERRLGDALKRRINAMLKAGLAAFLHSRAGTVSSRSLDRVPRFKAALRRALRPGATPASDPGTHGLSPRAALIYARLKSAVRNRKS